MFVPIQNTQGKWRKLKMRKEKKKMVAKQPYEAYTLPRSSEKGQPFVDFNKVLKSIIPRKVKTVKKRRTNGRS